MEHAGSSESLVALAFCLITGSFNPHFRYNNFIAEQEWQLRLWS